MGSILSELEVWLVVRKCSFMLPACYRVCNASTGESGLKDLWNSKTVTLVKANKNFWWCLGFPSCIHLVYMEDVSYLLCLYGRTSWSGSPHWTSNGQLDTARGERNHSTHTSQSWTSSKHQALKPTFGRQIRAFWPPYLSLTQWLWNTLWNVMLYPLPS